MTLSSSSPSLISALIRFDPDSGPIIQCHYPADLPPSLLTLLPAYALPDAIHKHNLDFVYFVADLPDDSHLLGVSCFKQCPAESSPRGYLQRALVIALIQTTTSHTSPFTILHTALSRPARLLFERHHDDRSAFDLLLKTLHDHAEIGFRSNPSSTNALSSSLRTVITTCTEQLLVLIKALNAGAQVVVYSQTASLHHLTSSVLSLAMFSSGPTVTLPYVPIQHYQLAIPRHKHALIGTNNAMLLSQSAAHVLFNIDDGDLRIEQGVWTDVLRLTRADRRFALRLASSADDAVSLYQDYQRRAVRNTRRHLRCDNPTIDDALRDFNTTWAGIMFGFTQNRADGDDDGEEEFAHPCHDDGDGDDVFAEGSSLESILSSISEQTAAIGDQAQRTFWQASSRISSWVGSYVSAEDEPDQDEPVRLHSVWTD